jgi:magnesium chelatase family protein
VLQGIEPIICEVEVDVADRGLAKTAIVGLPDAAVKESIDRVRSAICNSGFSFPDTRLLVNLAPADIRKESTSFDLPIAVGLLLAERADRDA